MVDQTVTAVDTENVNNVGNWLVDGAKAIMESSPMGMAADFVANLGSGLMDGAVKNAYVEAGLKPEVADLVMANPNIDNMFRTIGTAGNQDQVFQNRGQIIDVMNNHPELVGQLNELIDRVNGNPEKGIEPNPELGQVLAEHIGLDFSDMDQISAALTCPVKPENMEPGSAEEAAYNEQMAAYESKQMQIDEFLEDLDKNPDMVGIFNNIIESKPQAAAGMARTFFENPEAMGGGGLDMMGGMGEKLMGFLGEFLGPEMAGKLGEMLSPLLGMIAPEANTFMEAKNQWEQEKDEMEGVTNAPEEPTLKPTEPEPGMTGPVNDPNRQPGPTAPSPSGFGS